MKIGIPFFIVIAHCLLYVNLYLVNSMLEEWCKNKNVLFYK